MAESYEVVLQEVPIGDLLALLKALEVRSTMVSGLAVSEDIDILGEGGVYGGLIDAVAAYKGDVCLTERLYGFAVSGGVCLPFVLLRVVKYKDGVDVELSFDDVASFDIDRVMLAMKDYANCLSKKFYVTDFYGGLEPAIDIDTRYFTNNSLGPLGLSKNKRK